MKLVDLAVLEERLKPREKLETYGVESLNDGELLSVILGMGFKNLPIYELTNRLLSDFGTRGILQFQHLTAFQQATGLPKVKSCQLIAMGEYFRRLTRQDSATLKSSEQFYEYIKDDFRRTDFEQLRIVCLDPQRRVLYNGLIAQGEMNRMTVTLATVLHHPIRLSARHFYLAHNHPKGDPKASKEDITFTLKIKEESRKFGLEFSDHLILGEEGFYSFSLKGLL